MRYKRALLKISGEAIGGTNGTTIDSDKCLAVARQIKKCRDSGCEIGVVIGGGNLFRGLSATGSRMQRTEADMIGMLATVMNALAMREYLVSIGVDAKVFTATAIEKAAELYVADTVRGFLAGGGVALIAGGTGNPYFTTDTAAALRCAEICGDILLKATKVDGIYDSDPAKNPNATKYDTLSYQTALSKKLRVMDLTAFSFCMENSIPIGVIKLLEENSLYNSLVNGTVGTLVTAE